MLVVFVVYLAMQSLFFLSSLFGLFWNSESDIPDPSRFSSTPKEEIKLPPINVVYPAVTTELKNMKLDCAKNGDIWPQYRKEKMLCKNVYTADVSQIKEEAAKSNYDRLVFYGRYTIFDCPVVSAIRKIEDPIGGCYEEAKFLDGYLYPKMAGLFHIKIPDKRLFIYMEEDGDKVKEICKFPAGGCFIRDNSVVMIPGSIGGQFYAKDKEYRTSYLPDISSGNNAYYFYEIYPSNCNMNYIELHELTHYFDFYSYGAVDLWFEESMDVITNAEVMKEVCPPGTKFFGITKVDAGKITPADYLDVNSDDFILNMQDKRYENDNCRKAIITQINHLFASGGLDYMRKLYKILDSKVQYDYYRGITKDRLAAATLESSGNSPAVQKVLYNDNKCPK